MQSNNDSRTSTSISGQGSSQLINSAQEVSDGATLVIIENLLHVQFNAESSGRDRDGNNPPLLEQVADLLGTWVAAGTPINFDDVIAGSFLEIISRHLDGSLRHPAKRKATGSDSDVASMLTDWFLETIERSYTEERNNPKVLYFLSWK